jgi:hypothetical protein
MSGAKRARLANLRLGTSLLQDMDPEDAIARYERLVEDGLVEGFVQFALVATPTNGVFQVEMATFGITKQQAWDMLAIGRNAMRETMGFTDV